MLEQSATILHVAVEQSPKTSFILELYTFEEESGG